MSEKLLNFTDPNCGPYEGEDRILHAQFATGTAFKRRGGKAVERGNTAYYVAATANSTTLAGFAEVEECGVTGGRPESITNGDTLPVNFGLHKTAVFPTTGRVATVADVGHDFDVYVADNKQFIHMTKQTTGVLRVEKVLDDAGNWVAVSIPPTKRYGNL